MGVLPPDGVASVQPKSKVELYAAIRRNHLVPVPDVASIGELNALIDQWDIKDEQRRIRMRAQTIGERFAHERRLLAPLPVEPFEIGRLLTPRVNMHGQISVRTNRYSVPIRLAGHQVRVMLFASHLVVYHKGVEVARHERLIAKGGARLEPDHYLEALAHKPGALPGATALEQARAVGTFTAAHAAPAAKRGRTILTRDEPRPSSQRRGRAPVTRRRPGGSPDYREPATGRDL
ncbi:Mu transposase domain-containing protein [Nonomuraea sp. CA-143628]|uniref:Mu transposase domain-containing protein n=1 Tax=Nonomuraea sp. CA-143628 TaxID=3239997 RepID=UPI003D94359B